MSDAKTAYAAWEKQFPNATAEEKTLVREMYGLDDTNVVETPAAPSVTTKKD